MDGADRVMSGLSLVEMVRSGGYDTDKGSDYLAYYDALFAPFRFSEVRLLELGVACGGSINLWHDYFPQGRIVGLDAAEGSPENAGDRISVYRGRQEDLALLDRIASTEAPEGFDVIIDDAAHLGELARTSFWHLFTNHLKSGGIYAIEDWGTGYWGDWPDGSAVDVDEIARVRALDPRRFPSHDYGMVGFVKELVDEAGASDRSRGELRGRARRASSFRSLHISHGLAIVIKTS